MVASSCFGRAGRLGDQASAPHCGVGDGKGLRPFALSSTPRHIPDPCASPEQNRTAKQDFYTGLLPKSSVNAGGKKNKDSK